MKKIISLFLSLVMLLSITAGINFSALAEIPEEVSKTKGATETASLEKEAAFKFASDNIEDYFGGILTTDSYSVATINSNTNVCFFAFSPEESGVYSFLSTGRYDTVGTLLEIIDDEEYIVIGDNDDSLLLADDNYNFYISTYLEAGHVYALFTELSEYSTVSAAQFRVYAVNEHTNSYARFALDQEEKTATLVVYAGNDSSISIPSVVEGCTVRWIAYNALQYNLFSSAELPDTLWGIDEYAFYSTPLQSISIPDSVEFIGDGAFADCVLLEDIDITDNSSLAFIGVGAFANCVSLEKAITIPASVEYICEDAFYNTSISEITIYNRACEIYDGMETIPYDAVIYGYNNSTAQKYAKLCGNRFVSLGDYPFGEFRVYNQTQNGFSVECDEIAGADGYDIEVKNGGNWVKVASIASNSGTVSNLSSGTEYAVRMRAYELDGTAKTYISGYSDVETITTKPVKVTGLFTAARGGTGDLLKLQWNAQNDADGYNVYQKISGKYVLVATTTDNYYIFDNMVPGWEYYFRVTAYKGTPSNAGYGSDEFHTCAACPPMDAPILTKTGTNTIKVDWTVVNSHGYVIQWSTDPSFKTDLNSLYVTGHNWDSYSITTKENAERYYVRVRAWRNFEGGMVYGVWSDGSQLDPDALYPVTGLETKARGGTGERLKIVWDAQPNADSYNIYSKNAKGEWNLVASSDKAEHIFEDVVPGWEYYYKVAAVKNGKEGPLSEEFHTCAACPPMDAPILTKTGTNTIKVDWTVVNSHGYVIQWSTDPSFEKDLNSLYVTGHNWDSYSITTKENAERYYVRVRAWRNFEGGMVYGVWSNSAKLGG